MTSQWGKQKKDVKVIDHVYCPRCGHTFSLILKTYVYKGKMRGRRENV